MHVHGLLFVEYIDYKGSDDFASIQVLKCKKCGDVVIMFVVVSVNICAGYKNQQKPQKIITLPFFNIRNPYRNLQIYFEKMYEKTHTKSNFSGSVSIG